MSNSVLLDRRKVVSSLVEGRKGAVFIASLGSATYDLAAAGDHERNFYLWGAMGGAVGLGLGLAIAQPQTPVVVIVGDGEALMGMGAFATVAIQAPMNLSVVILDNGLYGETGSQVSHTSGGTDLAKVAAACGIGETVIVGNQQDVQVLAKRINRVNHGPLVAAVCVGGDEKPRCLPSRDGVLLKTRLRAAFGLDSM